MTLHKSNQTGFALLMSLLVVSVVISIAVSLIDLTIKQLRLASVSRDSEISFHAANAGVECARYFRNVERDDFEQGGNVTINCFGAGDDVIPADTLMPNVFSYEFDTSWTVPQSNAPRCSVVKMIVMAPPILGGPITLTNVPDQIPGYPNPTKTCPPGGRCTIISGEGYNQSCAVATTPGSQYGVIQREVLLEL